MVSTHTPCYPVLGPNTCRFAVSNPPNNALPQDVPPIEYGPLNLRRASSQLSHQLLLHAPVLPLKVLLCEEGHGSKGRVASRPGQPWAWHKLSHVELTNVTIHLYSHVISFEAICNTLQARITVRKLSVRLYWLVVAVSRTSALLH